MTNSSERLRRPARVRSLPVGDTKVTYVPDGAVQLIPTGWLPDTTDEVWAERPEYLDHTGNLVGSLGGLLVERDGRALLIDAGAGPVSMPAQPGQPFGGLRGGTLLDNLTALGRAPDTIEAVAITHLHLDHVGWAWHPAPGSERPAFTGARYLVAEQEWARRDLAEAAGTTRQMLDAMAPYVRTVSDGEEVFPGVHVWLTPGHTVGHTAYVISDGGQRLIAFGDALHSPVQVDHPEWSAVVDHDPELSAGFRHRLLDELARPGTTGFGIHFADVVFGRGDRDGVPAWRPVDG